MKYLFVLGRNPLLSCAEIFSYLEREGIKALNHRTNSNALLLEVDGELKINKIIAELGGTIAIGKILVSGTNSEVVDFINNRPIYFGRENKMIYSLLSFSGEGVSDEIQDAMKSNFNKERLKARYRGVSGTIKLQNGAIVRGSPEKILLRDMNYFIFGEGELAFGYLENAYDTKAAERLDMEKPERRESLAISPRLAKVLINLSQVKKGERVIDPFCGVGVIVSEALLEGINAVGADIDKEATKNAIKNLEWLRKNYKISSDSVILSGDSRSLRFPFANGIATEPSLGELMKKTPSREVAEEMVGNFERLMIEVLNNLKKFLKIGSKIAFSSPLVKSQKGRVACNIDNICTSTGLKVHELKGSNVAFPIREFRDEQVVGREIFVLRL